MKLFIRKQGHGAPIILLHGLFGSMDNLGMLTRGLVDSFTVIGVDLRNHGRSPHGRPHDSAHMAEDVIEMMEGEGINDAHFYGHSMGGKVAMAIALSAPKRVKSLVVGDIAPVPYTHHHDAILEGMQVLSNQKIKSRDAAEERLKKYESEPAILSFLLTNLRRDETGYLRWRLGLDNIVADYDRLMLGNEGGPYLGPVLFLKGGTSDYILGAHRAHILTLFPAASVRIIEGAGHWFHAEKPALTVRLVRRFLDGKI